jgi:hypothetical protein
MDTIINNPWVIGIVCGLGSGLAVFVISGWIISKREGKEIRQRIQNANSEILQALRDLIPEKELPPPGVIDSMRNSKARKYAAKKQELASTRQLVDEIIAEIMSNPFLSSQHKLEYCQLALQIARDDTATTGAVEISSGVADKGALKEKSRRDTSTILGAATFSSVLLGILSTSMGTGTVVFNKENVKTTLSFIAVAIIIPTFCVWVVDFYRDVQALRIARREAGSASAADSGRSSENANPNRELS